MSILAAAIERAFKPAPTVASFFTPLCVGMPVRVRFRGATNHDDVMDFSVFMSPDGVWTASKRRME